MEMIKERNLYGVQVQIVSEFPLQGGGRKRKEVSTKLRHTKNVPVREKVSGIIIKALCQY